MIYTVPHYFSQFHCIAGKCKDTCCAGWQIMIDEASLEKYRRTAGGLGNRLHNSISWKEGAFKQYGRRCAFLNEENLCDLYAEGGPDMLCRTCREYPRHTEEFEGCREISLSLSCEEAARLILGCEEQVRFVTRERPGDESYPEFDFFLYTKLADSRDAMVRILQDRSRSVKQRLSMVLALAHDIQRRINSEELFAVDGLLLRYEKPGADQRFAKRIEEYQVGGEERCGRMKELFGVFSLLEVLKPEWTPYIEKLQKVLFDQGAENYGENRRRFLRTMDGEGEMSVWQEQLAVYFLFVYYCGAVYDGRAYEKVKLAVVSILLISEMAQAIWQLKVGSLEFEDMVEAAHRYSKEVEHSDENLRAMERAFRSMDVFRLENLIRLL